MPSSSKRNAEIQLSHGAGGQLSRQLADGFSRLFDNSLLAPLADAAILELGNVRLAFSTDSHVISPLFFPGGDIGRLAVFGTVNDLCVMGASPLYLSCGLIIEEGLSAATLNKIMESLALAARETRVQIVTGDTKVVQRGKGDGLFINTTGLGLIESGADLCADAPVPGDQILVSGTLGDHAAAILTAREGLHFESHLVSDCAPLNEMIGALLKCCRGVKWMRDPTRGGLAAALNEFAENQPFAVELDEAAMPIKLEVRAICELLGFDPLHLANEGKAVMVVRATDAEAALTALRAHPLGCDAAIIGCIVTRPAGRVVLHTSIGGQRILDMPSGELLPRIC